MNELNIPKYTDPGYAEPEQEDFHLEDTHVNAPEYSVHKVQHHVKEVHPLIHKEVEETIVHPEVQHVYEHETLPTKIEPVIETPTVDPTSPHEESTLQKIKAKFLS